MASKPSREEIIGYFMGESLPEAEKVLRYVVALMTVRSADSQKLPPRAPRRDKGVSRKKDQAVMEAVS